MFQFLAGPRATERGERYITTSAQTDGARRSGRFPVLPLLLFTILALCLTAGGLFSSGTVCAGENDDTWYHLWAFWKSANALSGGDCGYLMSHMLSFPQPYFDPITVVDPLLSLLAVLLQQFLPNLTSVFNALALDGLVFSAMAGYLLTTRLSGCRMAGLLGGLVIGFNPLIFRQLAGGYVEYAWWGSVPLTVWLYLRLQESGRPRAALAYAAALLFTVAMSFYCAAVLALVLVADGIRQCVRLTHERKDAARLQLKPLGATVAIIAPVVLAWGMVLHWTGAPKPPRLPFPTGELTAHGTQPGVLSIPTGDAPASPRWMAQSFRTLRGSLDAYDLLHWSRAEAITQYRNCGDSNPLRRRFGQVFGLELIGVLGLSIVALAVRPREAGNWIWLGLAALFVLLALGPHWIWNRQVHLNASLPFAWLYRWVPGFSMIVIPGRLFLGAILCLTVLATRGLAVILTAESIRASATRRGAVAAAAMATVLGSFAALSYGGIRLPSTRISPLPVYEWLARQPGPGAVIELPLRGDSPARTYGQAVHKRPVFRGFFMEWVPAPPELAPLTEQNSAAGGLEGSMSWLTKNGFRYLVVHGDDFQDSSAVASLHSRIAAHLGAPAYSNLNTTAWAVLPSLP